MHVIGNAHVVSFLVFLAVEAAIYWTAGIDVATLVGLIVLVYPLGILVARLPGGRRLLALVPLVGLILLSIAPAAYWPVNWRVAAALVGLVVLVYLLGVSAAWLSGGRRLLAVVPFAGLIVLAIAATMVQVNDIHVAAGAVGLIAQAFLLGLSAAWLSDDPPHAIGASAVMAVVVALDFQAQPTDWRVVTFPAAIVAVFVSLVFLLGMSARWVPRERRMQGTGVIILFVGLMLLALSWRIYWSDRIEPRLCAESERIATTKQALEFGKRHLLENENFWRDRKAIREEIEELLQDERCCGVSKGDFFINDDSRWRVAIVDYKKPGDDFGYEVFFSECGKQVRVGAP